jgi:hypothetical protein
VTALTNIKSQADSSKHGDGGAAELKLDSTMLMKTIIKLVRVFSIWLFCVLSVLSVRLFAFDLLRLTSGTRPSGATCI